MNSVTMLFVNTPDVTALQDIRDGIRGVIFDVLDEFGIVIADQADNIPLNSSLEAGQGECCFITVELEVGIEECVMRACESKLVRGVLQFLPNNVNCTARILESV